MFKSMTDCTVDGVATLACLGVLMHNVVVLLLIAAAFATLLMLLIGGIRFSLSGGDPKKVAAARGTLTYAIIGIAIVFFAFVIMRVISTVTGNEDILKGPKIPVPSQRPSQP